LAAVTLGGQLIDRQSTLRARAIGLPLRREALRFEEVERDYILPVFRETGGMV
jgi:hypothetical protein